MACIVSRLVVAGLALSAALHTFTAYDAAAAQPAPNAGTQAVAVPPNASTGCAAPPAVLKLTQPNIFSEQQEQWLGDAMADMIERDYKPVQDPVQNAYLARITRRLLAVLPPTTIQFRVMLVDSSEVNGFSLAGGRVYVTRKLIANAKNEDEVASVIGHEMGHILSHQFAIETTADMQRLLGVTSVGDKADIYAKFQRLVDARMTDKHPGPGGDSDEKQNEADTVSVYATAAAGYRPQAYAEFWNRMFFVDGKVGGKLSDFFGTTKPEEKRLRAIEKLISALPRGCGATENSDTPEFQQWQALVVANQAVTVAANVKPVAEVELTPPLRMGLERLRYSRDGKYILAQDESSIFVLTREPFSQLFRIDAEKALPAEFSPDSERIVFHTAGLHTEDWSVKEQKLIAAHELVSKQDCVQTKLSPDGRTLFCFSLREEDAPVLDLTLLDVANGQAVFQKKGVYAFNDYGFAVLYLSKLYDIPADIVASSLSADGNVLLLGASTYKIAFDLRTRSLLQLGWGINSNISGAYAFVGNDKIAGVANYTKDSGIFSFPEGKLLQPAPFAVTNLESIAHGEYVLSRNVGDYAVGLVDTSTGKFILASKAPSMDVYDGVLLNENADGSVVLHKIGEGSANDRSTMLPLSPLAPSAHSVISVDGRFLAINTRTRGGVWDLETGERVLLANHFNSAIFAPDDSLYIDFPKLGKQDRAMVHFNFMPFSATPLTYKMDDTMYLVHGMLQEWKPAGNGKKGVELIVHDVKDNSILWRRTYDSGIPAHAYNFVPGETIFAFPLKSNFAKGLLKGNATLAAQAAAVKDRDAAGVFQVIDDRTGNVLHELVLEVPINYDGLGGINVVGDSLYLTSADNRTMVYSATTGAQVRQAFGNVIAVDSASGRVCTLNRRDEASVYDAAGQELAHFSMGRAILFAAFKDNEEGHANRLILLTADQKVRTMEIASAAAKP